MLLAVAEVVFEIIALGLEGVVVFVLSGKGLARYLNYPWPVSSPSP
jgi:hypothetical protein